MSSGQGVSAKEVPQPGDPELSRLDRTVSPRDMAQSSPTCNRGQLLATEGTATLLEMMRRTVGDRLALYLPPGTSVRHKTSATSPARSTIELRT